MSLQSVLVSIFKDRKLGGMKYDLEDNTDIASIRITGGVTKAQYDPIYAHFNEIQALGYTINTPSINDDVPNHPILYLDCVKKQSIFTPSIHVTKQPVESSSSNWCTYLKHLITLSVFAVVIIAILAAVDKHRTSKVSQAPTPAQEPSTSGENVQTQTKPPMHTVNIPKTWFN
jgi:hypothetical protein